MVRSFIPLVLILCTVLSCKQSSIEYPVTKKVDSVDSYFGQQIADPYRWLEDDHSEETKAWVKAQNEVTFSYLQKIPFRMNVLKRISELWNYERQTMLKKEAGIYYFERNTGLQNQNILYYKKNLQDEPKVLLDPNTISEEGTAAINKVAISADGKYLAYAISNSGSDWAEIFVKEIETGKILADHVKWVKFSNISWDKNGFFYSRYDEPKGKELTGKNEFHKLYYHKLGSDQKSDILVKKHDTDPGVTYNAEVTEDRKFLVISENKGFDGNKIIIRDIAAQKDLKLLGSDYSTEFHFIGNHASSFYFITSDGAPKRKIVSLAILGKGEFVTIVPEKEYVLRGADLNGKSQIVAHYMKDAQSRLETFDLKGRYLKDIALPSPGAISDLSSKAGDDEVLFTFTSFTYPPASYLHNVKTDQTSAFFKSQLEFKPEDYVTEQIFYPSKDGTKIPMFVVYKKGMELNGKNPTLLYGYGGFNINVTPAFNASRLVWLENGGIYVSANLRGGGEYGKTWHSAGTKLNKQNVFDDFIAAAEYLIQNKYTSPEKLAIMGGSNGGLLVGAVTNQRPDLFKVAIPMVGVMDMLRFHKFTIGSAWTSDYGSSDDSVQFPYILKFSPVHNISDTARYPAVLVTTADHDDRVVPAHSFKYIATLQEKYKGENPVLIRIQTNAGHGAGKPVAVTVAEHADVYSFIFKNLGVTPKL